MKVMEIARRSRDGDRGASAIMVAASLLLLMGLAAIAVDAGIAYSDRRQQSSASDVGSLAALQFAKTTLGTPTECTGLSNKDLAACRGAVEALDVIEGTIPGQYTTADWTACADPDDDSLGYTQHSHISDCISFTSNLQRVRVVMPGTEVDTAFASAIGFNSVSVGAFAEAGLEVDIVGGVLPFAVGPAAAGTDHACFAAGDNNVLDIAPCSSGTEGNYGKLDLRLYGNENYGTPQICTGSVAQRMSTNIVVGSDHPLEPNPPSPSEPTKPTVNDVSNCANITNPVNQVEVDTGNSQGAIADGLFYGIATPSLEGRLMCKGTKSTNTANEDYPLGTFESWDCKDVVNLHPESMDHTPLWIYLNASGHGTGSGEKCAPGQLKDRAAMEACLEWWKDNAPKRSESDWKPLFTSDILESPRFAGVPLLDKNPSNGTSVKYTIKQFLPVYLETLYLGCNANTCNVVHSPGETSTGSCPASLTPSNWSCGWPANGTQLIEAISGFVLTLDMLPDDIAEKFPFREGTVIYNLYK